MKYLIDKKDIFKEVLLVLSHFNEDLIKKIPQKVFIKLVNLAADSDCDINIDINKSIEEQEISEESKDIISLIYYSCIADELEKKELINIWNQNDKNNV